MSRSPSELSRYAIDLVAAWSDGTLASSRSDGFHVRSVEHGRLRVHARSRGSESLIWYNVPEAAGDNYDSVVLVEFEPDDTVAGAWLLSAEAVQAAARSSTRQAGRLILKVPVGGAWTTKATTIDLQ